MTLSLATLRSWRRGNGLATSLVFIGAAYIVAYFGVLSTDAQDFAYQVPGMIGPLAVLIGVRINRPPDARPWIMLAAGLALSTTGDWTWVALERIFAIDAFPSVADVFYLAGIAFIAISVLRLVAGRIPGGDRAGVIDALIVAVGAGLLSWTFLMGPLVDDPLGSVSEIAFALAYPLLDILLIGVLVRIFLAPGTVVPSLRLMSAALIALLAADFPYAVIALTDGYTTGHIVEIGWLISPIAFGAAALHPSMRVVADPVSRREAELSWGRLALLAGASLMAPSVMVLQSLAGQPVDVPIVAAGCVCLFLLVIARLAGVVSDLRATLRDRRGLERELERRALQDPLTSLANRILFNDRLEHALTRRDEQVAIVFLDLDSFKAVNDTSGHDAGDLVLCHVADMLRRCVRNSDTVARLGGDEFAVLVDSGATAESATQLAERLLAAIRVPVVVAGRERTMSASAGVSIGTSGVATAQSLLREADIAMYAAKNQGRGVHVMFDPKTHDRVIRTMGLQRDLERAVREEQFVLHYQPVIELESGSVVGVEALVRWQHPTLGLLPPAEFIPLAEATGTIAPLGRWVVREACRQAASWAARWPSTRDPFMSINLSAVELVQPGLVPFVAETLDRCGVPPNRLLIEVTESTHPDPTSVAGIIAELQQFGVRVAIDDFGTGYASMSRLLASSFDVIKIDRSLVRSMASDARAESLIRGVIDLTRRLGAATIAEGVETAAELAGLRQIGCAMAQGYHFSPAVPPAELEALLGLTDARDVPATRPVRTTLPAG